MMFYRGHCSASPEVQMMFYRGHALAQLHSAAVLDSKKPRQEPASAKGPLIEHILLIGLEGSEHWDEGDSRSKSSEGTAKLLVKHGFSGISGGNSSPKSSEDTAKLLVKKGFSGISKGYSRSKSSEWYLIVGNFSNIDKMPINSLTIYENVTNVLQMCRLKKGRIIA